MAAKKHSARFDYVKDCFAVRKTWGKARVFKAVECWWITADEYEEICGEPYPTQAEDAK